MNSFGRLWFTECGSKICVKADCRRGGLLNRYIPRPFHSIVRSLSFDEARLKKSREIVPRISDLLHNSLVAHKTLASITLRTW